MATESVLVSEVIPATPDRIYSAWLSTEEHSKFTGAVAKVEPHIGGAVVAFDGYATGKNLELEPGRRIVQTWRTTEFPDGSGDSRVEITLEETLGGTLVTLLHTEIPTGQSEQYKQGWVEYYLEPLKAYFGARTGSNGHGGVTTVAQEGEPALSSEAANEGVADLGSVDDEAPAKPKAVKKPAVKAQAKPKAKPTVKAQAKPKAKPAPKAKAKSKAKAKTKAATKKPAKAKAAPKAKGKAKAAKKASSKKVAKKAAKPAKKAKATKRR